MWKQICILLPVNAESNHVPQPITTGLENLKFNKNILDNTLGLALIFPIDIKFT